MAGSWWLVVVCCILTVSHVTAITSRCSACRAITTEFQERLDKEKPRNHIDLRHRLDSQGKRYGKSIDYKFSELRAMELLDDLCDQLGSYSLYPVDCYASTGLCKPATEKPPAPAPPPPPPPPPAPADGSDGGSAEDTAEGAVPLTVPPSVPPATTAEDDASTDPPADAETKAADAEEQTEEKPRRRKQWVKTKGLQNLVEKLKLPRDEDTARTKELKNHCGRVMEDHEDALTAAIMRGALEEQGAAEAYLCYELLQACPSDKLEAGERASSSSEATAADEQLRVEL